MAKEQALQFIVRVNEDTAVQDKLKAVAKDGMAGLVKVGKELGFDFTAQDMQTAAVEQWGSSSAEISDEGLESIAGGFERFPKFKPAGSAQGIIAAFKFW